MRLAVASANWFTRMISRSVDKETKKKEKQNVVYEEEDIYLRLERESKNTS